MKPKFLIPFALIIIAAATTGILLWQKGSQTELLITQATPDIPTSNLTNAELLTRIQIATTQAKEGPAPLKGLAALSRLYHANGFTREAWQCYATLVLVEPNEPRWHYHFGRILAGYGQLEEATPLFANAAKIAPDYSPTHIRLGDTLLKQNRFQEANIAYQDALSKDASNAYALVGLARIAIAAEDWGTARIHLEKAVQTTNYQIGADLLGDVYEKLNLPSQENKVLQSLVWGSYADIPDPWSLSLMDDSYDAYQVSIAGGWASHQGDIHTGHRYIKRAAELDPNNSMLQFQLAGSYSSLNNIEMAERHYRTCVELQPDFADAWLALIIIAKGRQSPTLVRRTLDSALMAAPLSPSLHIEQGKIYAAQKRYAQAIPCFEKSIELRPHEAIGYIELAQVYLAQNLIEDGIKQIKEALIREPNHPIALTTMVFDAILRSDQADADKWLERVNSHPRIKTEEKAQLDSMYQRAFGASPRN